MPSSFLINYQQVRPSFLLRGNSRGARSQSELGKICWTPFPAPGPGDLELNKMPLLGCFRKQPHYRPLSPDPFLTSQQCHLHGPFSLVIWRPCPQGWAREDTGLCPWSQDTLQRPDAPGLKGGYFKQGGQERAFEEKPAGNPGESQRQQQKSIPERGTSRCTDPGEEAWLEGRGRTASWPQRPEQSGGL